MRCAQRETTTLWAVCDADSGELYVERCSYDVDCDVEELTTFRSKQDAIRFLGQLDRDKPGNYDLVQLTVSRVAS